MFTRFSRSLLSLAACAALVPVATGQTAASTEATFKQAAQQHAAGLKADFAKCTLDLRSSLDDLIAKLKDGSTQPPELPDGLADAFAQAYTTATQALFTHVVALDDVGTFLDVELVGANPDAGAPAGLVIGAGGVLDDFHRKLQSALTNLDKSFDRELRRALQKARKILPDSTIVTGQVFPLTLMQLADPGLDENASESSFYPLAPLFLSGYGDENERHIAVLGMSTGGQSVSMNVYDGDGKFLETLGTTPLSFGAIYGGAGPVPAGAQEPHGNLRIEMADNSSGWTAGIGY
jgi:hypothetical protein